MVGIIIIGDELLSGQIEDKNLKYILKSFSISGHDVSEVRFVSDDIDQVLNAFKDLSNSCEFVISSGGVGPTHDDITIIAVAKAFNQKLYRNEYLENSLRRFYKEEITESALKMADVPVGSELLDIKGDNWPILKMKNCFILPGVPEIFRQKFDRLMNYLPLTEAFYRAFFYLNSDEIFFAEELKEFQKKFNRILIGSYPIFGRKDYTVQISIKHKNKSELESLYRELKDFFVIKGILVNVTEIKEID